MRTLRAMILVLGLLVTSSGATSDTLAQSHRPASPWTVGDAREIAVDGKPMALSPDGQWLAGPGPDKDFCVWDVETLDPACDGLIPSTLLRSIAWAPDSTAVAFSINAPVILRDSDVLVFEVATGRLVNLTDDDPGDEDFAPLERDRDAADPVPVDLFPAWSPDSDELVFARTVWGPGSLSTTLMTIARTGGEPVRLQEFRPRVAFQIFSPMRWLDDDSILYSILGRDADDRSNGIWRLPVTGDPELVVSGDEIPIPSIADVSPDETIISVVSLERFVEPVGSSPTYFLVDLASGEATSVEELTGAAASPEDLAGGNSLYLSGPARFSPDGETMIIGSGPPSKPGEDPDLLVIDADGNVHDMGINDVLTDEVVLAVRTREMGIDWAVNDTLFIGVGGANQEDILDGLLVTLVPADEAQETTPVVPCGCTPPPRD